MSRKYSVTVDADYSQFEIQPVRTPPDARAFLRTHLTQPAPDSLMLTVEREYGEVTLDVALYDFRPAALDDSWLDVVEVTFIPSEEGIWVQGWAGGERSLHIPVPAGEPHRLRYAIANMDAGDWHGDGTTQRYVLELWPEAPSASATLVQRSEAGRYWAESKRIDIFDHLDPIDPIQAQINELLKSKERD